MKPAVEVFRANLRHAVRNRETVTIGGGQFYPAEQEALDAHLAAVGALVDFRPLHGSGGPGRATAAGSARKLHAGPGRRPKR